MNYALRCLNMLISRAHERYRFYLYWRKQERMARVCSRERLSAIQWKKFTRLLHFAYERIPYYNEKFREAGVRPEDIRTRDDLQRIPILTKDDIRQNFPDRILDNRRKFRMTQIGQTSGSTAESLYFVRPDKAWIRSLYYSVFLRTNGMKNLPILVFTTPHCTAASCSLRDEENATGPRVSKFQKMWFLRHLEEIIGLPSSENILGASDEFMNRLTEILSKFSPCILVADPVYLGALARYLRRTGKRAPELEVIITTFELLTPSLEDLLRDVFECEVYTQYGASEIMDIANECENHRLHVRMTNVMLEVMRDGRPARPGELGRAIVTDLCNTNMPFIRYDIGDVVTRGDHDCPCGRNTETIECVHGRIGDLIKTNGAGGERLLTPFEMDRIFRGAPGIGSYRFVQKNKNTYDIAVLPDGSFGEPERQKVIQRCRSVLGADGQYHVHVVDEIKPQRSKKFRFVHSEMPPQDL